MIHFIQTRMCKNFKKWPESHHKKTLKNFNGLKYKINKSVY